MARRKVGELEINATLALVKLDQDLQKLNKKLTSAQEQWKRKNKAFADSLSVTGLNQSLEVAIKGLQALRGAWNVAFSAIEKGQAFYELSGAFENLYGKTQLLANDGLSTLREAVNGTVSDIDILKSANLAAQAGLSPDKFLQLAKAAETLGDVVGLGPVEALQDLSKALALGKEKAFANYGITIDNAAAYDRFAESINKTAKELTEAEQLEAFQEEILRKIAIAAPEAAGGIETVGDAAERASVAWSNLQTQFGNFINSSPLLTKSISVVAEALKQIGGAVSPDGMKSVKAIEERQRYLLDYVESYKKQSKLAQGLSSYLEDFVVAGLFGGTEGKRYGAPTADEALETWRKLELEKEKLVKEGAERERQVALEELEKLADQEIAIAERSRADALAELEKMSAEEKKKAEETAKHQAQLNERAAKEKQQQLEHEQKEQIRLQEEAAEEKRRQEEELAELMRQNAEDWAQQQKDAAESWIDFFGETLRGEFQDSRDTFLDMFSGMGGEIAAQVTGGIFDGVRDAKGIGAVFGSMLMQGLSQLGFDTVAQPQLDANGQPVRDTNGNIVTTGGRHAGYIAAGVQIIGGAVNAEQINRQTNSQQGTGGAVGSGIGAGVGAIFGDPQAGAAIGNMFGSLLGSVLGRGTTDPGHRARHEFAGWFEDQIQEIFTLTGPGGALQRGNRFNLQEMNSAFSSSDWSGQIGDGTDAAFAAFSGVGDALEELAGVSENVGSQIAYMLSNNLGGSLDDLRLMVKRLGLSFEDLSDVIWQAAYKGEVRWSEYLVELSGLQEAFKPGLAAVGDFTTAFQRLIDSGGRGMEALEAVRNEAIEGMEAGASSLGDLQQRLLQSGFSPEYVNSFFQSLSQNNITSLQQLSEATDQQLAAIVGNMEQFSTSLASEWQALGASVDEVTRKLEAIPAEVPVTIRINVDDPEGGLDLVEEDNRSNSSSASPKAAGGIFSSAAWVKSAHGFSVIGEAGPEAVLPLQKVNGKLGVRASGASAGVNVTFAVDARGAAPGVETRLMSAMRAMENRAVSRALQAVSHEMRRG